MPNSPVLVKQEPGLVDVDEFHLSDPKLQGARLRSHSMVSSASESLSMHDDDESDAEMNDHLDGEYAHFTWRTDLLSQRPPPIPGNCSGYSSSEETYSKERVMRRVAHHNVAMPHDDEEEDQKPFVKREDHPISDFTSHDRHRSSPLFSSPGPIREASWSRSSTPTLAANATFHHASKQTSTSTSLRVQVQHRGVAAAFSTSQSLSLSRATIDGTPRRRTLHSQSTSELIDDKRRVFLKQEVLESEVDSLDYDDNQAVARSDILEGSSRGPSLAIASRASSEENESSGAWTEFYVALNALHSLAELVAVSAGPRPRRGAKPKPLDVRQAEKVQGQLTIIESTAYGLRQMLSSYFQGISTYEHSTADPNYENPSCHPSSVDPPAPEAPPTDAVVRPVQSVPTPTTIATDTSAALDFGWHSANSSQTLDTIPFDETFGLTQPPPSQAVFDETGEWNSSYNQTLSSSQLLGNTDYLAPMSATPILDPMGVSQAAPMMPVQPTPPMLDSSSIFAPQNMIGVGAAAYYSTINPFQVTSIPDHTAIAPPNPAGLSLPISAALVPLNSYQPVDTNISTEMQDYWVQELIRFGETIPDGLGDSCLGTSLSNDYSSNLALPEHSSSLPSLEPTDTAANSTTVQQLAPDTTDDTPRIPCDVEGCTKTFRRPYLLRDHMRNNHSGESSSYVCKFEGCTKRFGSQSNLTRHHKTHNRDKAALINEDHNYINTIANRLASPAPNTSLAPLAVTPRRSRRLQNTGSNPLGQKGNGHRILEPRTPATFAARVPKVLA